MSDTVSDLVSGGFSLLGLGQSRQARKQERRARELEQRRMRLKARRQAQEQLRAIQVARAQLAQQGENLGVANSSTLEQATGSVVSQGFGNIQFLNQLGLINQEISDRLIKANQFATNAQALAQLSSLLSGGIFKPAPRQGTQFNTTLNGQTEQLSGQAAQPFNGNSLVG